MALSRPRRTGHGQQQNGPLNPDFFAEPAALPRRANPAHAQKLRMWLFARARPLGIGRLRFPRRHRPQLRRHLLQQLLQNGLLPIVLTEEQVERLFQEVYATEGYQLSIDLEQQTVTIPSGETFTFDITEHRKHCLLNGLDEIGLTLQHADDIKAFEAQRRQSQPWLFNG